MHSSTRHKTYIPDLLFVYWRTSHKATYWHFWFCTTQVWSRIALQNTINLLTVQFYCLLWLPEVCRQALVYPAVTDKVATAPAAGLSLPESNSGVRWRECSPAPQWSTVAQSHTDSQLQLKSKARHRSITLCWQCFKNSQPIAEHRKFYTIAAGLIWPSHH